MGQRVFGQGGIALHEFHHQVVCRRLAFGNNLGREVRQRDQCRLQLLLHVVRLGLQTGGFFLEVRNEVFAFLGLLAAALTHQGTDLLGGLVLCGQRGVEFDLDGLASVVERDDLFDDGPRLDALLGEFADGGLFVIADLLQCKHSICFL